VPTAGENLTCLFLISRVSKILDTQFKVVRNFLTEQQQVLI